MSPTSYAIWTLCRLKGMTIAPPTNFLAFLIPGGVSLTWTDSTTSNTEVQIERALDDADYSLLATVDYGVETYDDTDIPEGTVEVAYRLRAVTVEVVMPEAPVVVSASVANATPTKVDIVFDKTINDTLVPDISAFSISGKTLTGSPSISDYTVTLTTTIAFAFGETAMVSYTKPGVGTVLTGTNTATIDTFSGQSITNNVAESLAPPVLSSVTVEDANHDKVIFTFDSNLNESSGTAASAFGVTGKTVSGIVISGATVTATLDSRLYWNDAVDATYTKPGSNPLKGDNGVDVDSISATAITNNIALDSGTTTLVAAGRYTDAPTDALKALINKTIVDLKSDGVFAKGDAMYIRGVHESLLARQNWIKDAHNSTLSATPPTFTAKQGFQGNGTSSYINNNYNPSSDAVNYTLANCAIVTMYRLVPTATAKHLLGAVDTVNSRKIDFMFYTTANERIYINYNANYNDQLNITDGIYAGYTRDNGYIQAYADGSAVGTNLARTTDAQLINLNIYELTWNYDGNPNTYNNGQISFSFYGAALSPTEQNALYTRIKYFYDNVNATF